MISVSVKGLTKLQRALKAETQKQEKALNTAVRVEGFRLMRLLQRQIREGSPGGAPFTPLSFIARRLKRTSKALRRLAIGVRYHVIRDPFSFHFGWVGPGVSKSWKRLAERHQEGFISGITEKRRRYMRIMGSQLPKGSKARRYFFLRKTTMQFKTPDRPIMEPFWRAYQDTAWKNIRNNFRRKMRGERI